MQNTSAASAEMWQGSKIPVVDLTGAYSRVSLLRKVVLWTVGLYIVLNSGFEMVRFPPVGPGIPIGELVLIVCLCIISTRALLPKIAKEVWILPILVWWGMSLSRALIDVSVGGAWSLRDASQAIESLYLIVGFWLVNSPGNLQYFFSWLKKLFIVIAFYGLLMPFDETLRTLSPTLHGVASGATPIFFTMTNTAQVILWSACWLLIDRPKNSSAIALRMRTLISCLLVAFAVIFPQGRTMYIEVLAVGAILFAAKRRLAGKWLMILLLGVAMIGAISVSGLQLKGGRGHTISLDFIMQHFESISGSAQSEDVAGAAEGVSRRLGWWRHIYSEMSNSPRKMIFGLGYGMPLTDFHALGGAAVREPHNSYISVVARLGIVGFLVWFLMQASLYYSLWRSYQLCRRMQWTRDQDNLLLLLIFGVLILIVAIGEPGFEMPFNAIPYYLFFGVVLRYGRYLRQSAAVLGSDAV
jgi:hypothetical protein